MTMQRYKLVREGFNDLTIRKVTLVDDSYHYEMLMYTNPHTGDERWIKIYLDNKVVEEQIRMYSPDIFTSSGEKLEEFPY